MSPSCLVAEDPPYCVYLRQCEATYMQSHSIAQKTGASRQKGVEERIYFEELENAAEAGKEEKKSQSILLDGRAI